MKVTKKSTPVKKEKDLFVCVCKSGTFLESGKKCPETQKKQQKKTTIFNNF